LSWGVGNSVTADLTDVNIGLVSAGYNYTRLYLSTNDIISSSDTQLGSDIYFGSISAGGSLVQSVTFTVPNVTDGTFYVGAIVDYYANVVESNETNNTVRRNGTTFICGCSIMPDLTCTSIALSTSNWIVGDSVTADLTVENIGIGPAGYNYTRLYLSGNDTISSSDTQLGIDIYFSSISTGNSQVQSVTFTVPSVTDGTYYVGAIVDYYYDVAETDETNNIVRRNGTVTIPITYNISASASPTEGGSVSGDGLYLSGATASLTATPAIGYDFLYWTENSSVVSIDPNYIFTVNGDRTLVANFERPPVSVSELEGKDNIMFYPNPVNDILYIQLNSEINQDINISILDVNNKLIATYIEENFRTDGPIKLNLSQLTSGVYFMKINNSDQIQIKKIIKE
jgi:hypothetical protein